jgi:translocator protein
MATNRAADAHAKWDRLRQTLNVLFTSGQILATTYGYVTGLNKNFTETDPKRTPPIVPAPYAFAIWGPIYAASIGYAVYQGMPEQRENPLLRQIGFYTAAAFLGTTLWLIAAQLLRIWLTLLLIFAILLALLGAFIQLIRAGAPRSTAEQYLVVMPISLFTGWITVAAIANSATTLYTSGVRDWLFTDETWATLMVKTGGLIGAGATLASRGNIWYAGTLIWGLIGIAVANMTRQFNPGVAFAASLMALVVGLVLFKARRFN